MNPQDARQEQPGSHLFTVRLWQEEMHGGAWEVRMQVRHVLSGETRYFRTWPALVAYLQHVAQGADPWDDIADDSGQAG